MSGTTRNGSLSTRRLVAEPPPATRTEFQRDRDRVIHCGAFRRLALKTQVFLPDEGDQYRTRLTHTIEVAQIARSIARALGLDEDLAEALALAHDLGHPPFGHTGEAALDRVMAPFGGFDHNLQTLRVVTRLERRYPAFDGLNLTAATLEGLVKRKGPLVAGDGRTSVVKPFPVLASDLAERLGFSLATWPSPEAQAAAVADDIAYNAHDLEDGLDAGLFALDDLAAVPFLADMIARGGMAATGADRSLAIRALAREMVGVFVEGVIAESRSRLAMTSGGGEASVTLSPRLREASLAVKRVLHERMYRHPRLLKVRDCAFDIVTDLARHLVAAPRDLPQSWASRAAKAGGDGATRIAADYVAGLTDRHAEREHRRLFPTTPGLR